MRVHAIQRSKINKLNRTNVYPTLISKEKKMKRAVKS